MKNEPKKMLKVGQVTIDPNLKSHRGDPFVVRKVEAAKKALENVDLSILNLPRKA
jgi:hypothetical protein